VTSRNSHPQLSPAFADFAPPNPYNDAAMLSGWGSLSATFAGDFASTGTTSAKTEPILNTVNNYAIVPCTNPIVPSPFLSTSEPNYAEAGSLVAPFFYKDTAGSSTDNELTFFVQPSVTETLLVEWEWWAVPIGPPISLENQQTITSLPVIPQVPVPVFAGPLPEPDSAYSLYQVQDRTDWVTQPATVVDYSGVLVNRTGGLNVRPSATTIGSALSLASPSGANGSAGIPETPNPPQGLTVVGADGLNPAILTVLSRSNGANVTQKSLPSPRSTGGAS
jgi:hypothetical protein